MLQRKVLALLFISKMAISQSVYPTTAVSYSTNAVPTIQTLPVSPTVSPIPATVSPIPATVNPIPVTGTPIPAKVTALPMSTQPAMPVASSSAIVSPVSSSSGVKVTTVPASILSSMSSTSMSSVVSSPISPASKITEPKAHFLPASIPDPKVTILPYDTPAPVEVSCLDPYLVNMKDYGPASPVKRITMACTDDFILPNEDPLCPGIPKKDFKPPTPVPNKGNKGNLNNPIDFEGLMDGFMSCL